MSEVDNKLRDIETPLCDARDLVEAARMATAYLDDEDQKTALQAVLWAAYCKLGAVKRLWMEAHELAAGRAALDPIFAAIEAHREAYKAYAAAAKAKDNAEAEDKASDEAALKLTTMRPKTFEGATALLDYFAEIEGTDQQVFPVDARDGDEEFPFATWVVRNAACALREVVED
jgi:hypothetical protein